MRFLAAERASATRRPRERRASAAALDALPRASSAALLVRLRATPLELRLALSAARLDDAACACACENRSAAAGDLDRAGALRRSLLSTHPILRVSGGRFVSPLDVGAAARA